MGRFYEWEPFAEGKRRQLLGFQLLLCFGKKNVIFTQWKPSGFDYLSLAHFINRQTYR